MVGGSSTIGPRCLHSDTCLSASSTDMASKRNHFSWGSSVGTDGPRGEVLGECHRPHAGLLMSPRLTDNRTCEVLVCIRRRTCQTAVMRTMAIDQWLWTAAEGLKGRSAEKTVESCRMGYKCRGHRLDNIVSAQLPSRARDHMWKEVGQVLSAALLFPQRVCSGWNVCDPSANSQVGTRESAVTPASRKCSRILRRGLGLPSLLVWAGKPGTCRMDRFLKLTAMRHPGAG